MATRIPDSVSVGPLRHAGAPLGALDDAGEILGSHGQEPQPPSAKNGSGHAAPMGTVIEREFLELEYIGEESD